MVGWGRGVREEVRRVRKSDESVGCVEGEAEVEPELDAEELGAGLVEP